MRGPNEKAGWVTVPPNVAAGASYYGVDGWLAGFLLLYFAGGLFSIYRGALAVLASRYSYGGSPAGPVGGLLVLLGLALLVVVVQGFRQRPAFPRWIIGLLALFCLLQLLLATGQYNPGPRMLAALSGAAVGVASI